MRYDRAVGREAQSLGWMPLVDWGWTPPARLPESPAVKNFWNAGVNMAYGRPEPRPETRSLRAGGDSYLKPKRRRSFWGLSGEPNVSPEQMDRATVYMQYGNTEGARHELGDLFNDVMGAIVPGWDQRPQALKDIRVNADPAKILQAAQKLAPGAGEQAITAANAAGLDVYVQTPAGRVKVTPGMAQGAYANYPMYTKTREAMGSLFESPLTLLAIGAGGLGLYLLLKK